VAEQPGPGVSFLQGWAIQRRVIHAVMMREVRTRFGRNRLGYLWALAEPVFWVATFAAVRHYMGAKPPAGMDMLSFLATGIVTFIMFRSTLTHSMASITGNRPLLFYPQVRPLDIAFARGLLEGATLAIVFVLLLAGNGLYQGDLWVDNAMHVVAGLLMAWLLGVGLGLFFMGLSVYSAAIEQIVPILMRPMLFVSGVFYTAEELSEDLREALLYNPIFHAVELVRHGWFREFDSAHIDLPYVFAWILLFGYFGLLFERFARRRLELT
jgi:capsular polysaccharide transport system permease protein